MKKVVLILVAFSVISFVSCSEESINNENDLALEESLSIDLDDFTSVTSKPDYNKAKTLVDAWIARPTHRANILGDFNYFDISTDFSKSGVMYSTNIFIKK